MKRFFYSGKYKKTGLYKYFISYIFLLLIILGGISIVVRTQLIRGFEDTIRESAAKSLGHFQNMLDNLMENLLHISNSVTTNRKLISYFSQIPGYHSYEAAKELNRYRESYNALLALGIVFPNTGNIITDSGLMTLDHFFGKAYAGGKMTAESFANLCKTLNTPTMIPLSGVSHYSAELMDIILIIWPVPVQNKNPNGFVLFLIKKEYFYLIMKTTNIDDNSIVYIINRNLPPSRQAKGPEDRVSFQNGDFILSLGGKNFKQPSDNFIEIISLNNRNDTTVNIADRKFHILESDGSNGFTYIVATPLSRYFRPVNDSTRVFIIALICIAGIGLVYSVFVTFRHYLPIRRLADSLGGAETTENSDKRRTELEWISSRLNSIKELNLSLSYSLSSRQSIITQQLLFALVTGYGVNREEMLSMLEVVRIDRMDQGFFQVIAVEIEPVEKNLPMVMVYLKKVMKDAFLDYGEGYCVQVQEANKFYFLFHSLNRGLEKEEILSFLNLFRLHIGKTFKGAVTTGIGSVQDDLGSVSASYRQAEECLRYKSIKGTGADIYYEDISGNSFSNLDFLIDIRKGLENQLKSGDLSAITSTINTVSRKLKDDHNDPVVLPYFSWSLYLSIQPFVSHLGTEEDLESRIEVLLKNRELSLEEIQKQYLSVCKIICDKINSLKTNRSGKLLEDIHRYARENVSDKNLTLEGISEVMDMNPSYLTRFFKQQTGESLMKYIDNIRMETARQMLKNTKSSLETIIDSCGYVDKNNFCRKFKSREGITPMQYRKQEKVTNRTG
jgi:AraC-like DNA-binding protein